MDPASGRAALKLRATDPLSAHDCEYRPVRKHFSCQRLNLLAKQDMTMPFVMAAMMIVLGLGVGYVISRTED